MASALLRSSSALLSRSNTFCSIPVKQVASVLKLNVTDEPTALKLDAKMKEMTEMMRAHEGFEVSSLPALSVPGF